jgi:hypothetical protein
MRYLSSVAVFLALLNVASARAQSGGGGTGSTGLSQIAAYRGVRLKASNDWSLTVNTVMSTGAPSGRDACADFYDVAFSVTDEQWQQFLNEGLNVLSKELNARVSISQFSPSWNDVHTLLRSKGTAPDIAAWKPDPAFRPGRYVDTSGMPFVEASLVIDNAQRVPANDNIILSLFGSDFKKQCTFTGKGLYETFLDPPTFTHFIVLGLTIRCGSRGLLVSNFKEFTPAASNVVDWTKGLAKRIADGYTQSFSRDSSNKGGLAELQFNGITQPFENWATTSVAADRCTAALKARARR